MPDTHSEAPIYFGPQDRPLFGFLHTPVNSDTATANQAVVICQPFGYEAICAYRSLRHLAHALASKGIPSLRFDYDGVGDSAGSDLDPNRVDAWVGSIVTAIDELRRHTGAEKIYLVGVRLGAALAVLAARLANAESLSIAGLAAVAPIVSGRAYLRELRALQMALRLPESPQPTAQSAITEALGFAISATTKEAVQAIDLKNLTDRVAPNILLIDRHDMPANDAWAAGLREHGCEVRHLKLPGYTEMVLDPHNSVVPAEMWNSIVEWLLAQRALVLPQHLASDRNTQSHADNSVNVSARIAPSIEEHALYLDEHRRLFGVLTMSTANPPQQGKSDALIILNAGSIHRVGPNRMFVELAQRLAANGMWVLRLDISGIGDSKPYPGEEDNIVYTDHANDDIATAVQFLSARGARRIMSVGLCSGAYNGFKAAVQGIKLDGVLLINPLTFFWNPGMSLDFPAHRVAEDAARYKKNAFQLSSWLKLLRGEVDVAHALQVVVRKIGAGIAGHWRNMCRSLGMPLKEDLGYELQIIAARKTQLRFIFAAEEPGLEILRVQGGNVVPKLLNNKTIAIEVIDGPDHTFTACWAQRKLLDTLITTIGELR